jgi:hypothetical protein
MLLSIISSSAISSSAISSNAIAMSTTPGLTQYGSAVVAGLIIFLCSKEVISTSELWNRNLNNSFNMVILPMVLCFVTIAAYKVNTII